MIIYGKETALERLREYRRSGRFPHAILLTGDRGVGKKLLADYIAMLWLCEKGNVEPCFSCAACRMIEAHNHPDVVYVQPILEAAKARPNYSMVDAIRDIIKNGYLKPNNGSVRVYIFAEAEAMTPECQNALLKFIEEPLEFNRFVFTTASERSILPTIRSRVTKISVDSATKEECISALIAAKINKKTAEELSERFCGNIGLCLSLNGDSDEKKLYESASAILSAFLNKSELETAVALNQISTRDDLKSVLTVISGELRDALVISDDGEPTGTDSVLSRKLSSAFSRKRIYRSAEIIEKYIGLCEFNPNVNITANAVCAELFGIFEQEGITK